jgi:class 3 adenylate cyclase
MLPFESFFRLCHRRPLPTAPVATASAPEAVGERRHVTVMFCDLVDSTGIAAKLDAEEWRHLVGAYLEAASTAVTEMGGKVAKKLGDGLMATRWRRRTMPSGRYAQRSRYSGL